MSPDPNDPYAIKTYNDYGVYGHDANSAALRGIPPFLAAKEVADATARAHQDYIERHSVNAHISSPYVTSSGYSGAPGFGWHISWRMVGRLLLVAAVGFLLYLLPIGRIVRDWELSNVGMANLTMVDAHAYDAVLPQMKNSPTDNLITGRPILDTLAVELEGPERTGHTNALLAAVLQGAKLQTRTEDEAQAVSWLLLTTLVEKAKQAKLADPTADATLVMTGAWGDRANPYWRTRQSKQLARLYPNDQTVTAYAQRYAVRSEWLEEGTIMFGNLHEESRQRFLHGWRLAQAALIK